MTCLGVLDRGERGDNNGTSLKEGGLVEMSTTVLHSRCSLSSLELLTVDCFQTSYQLITVQPIGMVFVKKIKGFF